MSINAEVRINASVQSRRRSTEPFRPTDISVHDFHAVTDLDAYLSVTPTISGVIWEFLQAQRAELWENYVQLEIRLDNVTAVPMGKGAYPLPKGHRSMGLTGSEITDQEIIERSINNAIAELKQKARY